MIPGSPEWRARITASKVAAILSLSPWESPRSLWHHMRGDLERPEQTKIQSRGHYLEPAILAWWRDRHNLGHDEGREYQLQPTYKIGDWAAATPDMVARHSGDDVLVEAKSAARDESWGEPGTDQIPLYYFIQCQWQMHVSGVHQCYVPMIDKWLEFREYIVDYLPDEAGVLERRCRAFYDSLTSDVPPDLDDTVATYNAVRKLHPEIERGTSVELTRTEAWDLAHSNASLKALEAQLRLAKSTVIDRMGRAQYATHAGARIARRQPRGDAVTFVITGKPTDITPERDAA